MPLGDVLYESDVTLSHVYFPATAIVSLLASVSRTPRPKYTDNLSRFGPGACVRYRTYRQGGLDYASGVYDDRLFKS